MNKLFAQKNALVGIEGGKGEDPLSEEGAGDDEGDVDGVAAHEDLVEAFENASSSASSRH